MCRGFRTSSEGCVVIILAFRTTRSGVARASLRATVLASTECSIEAVTHGPHCFPDAVASLLTS